MIYECARLKRRRPAWTTTASRSATSSRRSTTTASAARTLWPYVAGGDPRPAQHRAGARREEPLARRLLPAAAEPQHLPRRAARDRRDPGLGRAARRLAARPGARGQGRDRAATARRAARGARRTRSTPSSSSATRRAGFLVLNSWGRDWGGWPPDAPPAAGRSRASRSGATTTGPTPSWTAGCCASASARRRPSSISIGDQGLGFGAEAAVRATPVHAILGNFLHLDDGDFVALRRLSSPPAAPSRRPSACSARTPRSAKPYRGVLLTFAGGLVGPARRDRPRRALEAPGARRAAGIPSPCSGASTTSSRRARCSTASSPRRRSAPARPGRGSTGWSRSWRTASAGRSGATSPAPPTGRRAPAARCTTSPAPARRSRRRGPASACGIVAESEGAFALAALLRAMQTEAFAAEAGAFFEMLEVGRPRRAAAQRRASSPPSPTYLNAGWGAGAAGPAPPACTCRPPATRSGWRCRPTASPTSTWSRRAFQPPRRGRRRRRPPGRSRANRPRSAIAARLGRLARRAADRARADRLAARRGARRRRADQPAPAHLPVGRGRPPQGRPAPPHPAAPRTAPAIT